MATSTKTKIDVTFTKPNSRVNTGTITLRRNGVKEVTIKGASDFLHEALLSLTNTKDYDQFKNFYELDDCSLGSWLYNVVAMERDLAYEFQKVIVIPEVNKK